MSKLKYESMVEVAEMIESELERWWVGPRPLVAVDAFAPNIVVALFMKNGEVCVVVSDLEDKPTINIVDVAAEMATAARAKMEADDANVG